MSFPTYFVSHASILNSCIIAHTLIIQEADDLLKLADNFNHDSTLELEIEWYMKIKQNGGVHQALNVVMNNEIKYIPYKRGVLRTSFPLWVVTVLFERC